MPRIPTYPVPQYNLPQVDAAPLPGPRAEALPSGVAGFGRALGQAGDEFARAFDAASKERIESVFNEVFPEMDALGNKAAQTLGADIRKVDNDGNDFQTRNMKALQGVFQKHREGLNDYQRKLFDQQAEKLSVGFQRGLASHEAREVRAADITDAETQIKTSQDSIAESLKNGIFDGFKFQLNAARAIDGAERLAKLKGATSPEALEIVRKDVLSGSHGVVLNYLTSVAKQPEAAAKWLTDHKDQIDGKVYNHFAPIVAEGEFNAKVDGFAAQAVSAATIPGSSLLDANKAMEKVRELAGTDAHLRKSLEAEVKDRLQVNEHTVNTRIGVFKDGMYKVWGDTHSSRAVRKSQAYLDLVGMGDSPLAESVLQTFRGWEREAVNASENNPGMWIKRLKDFNELVSRPGFADIDKDKLFSYAPTLGQHLFGQVYSKWMDERENKPMRLASFKADNDEVNVLGKALGIDISPGNDDTAKAKLALLRINYEKEVGRWQVEKGRALMPSERDEVRNHLAKKVMVVDKTGFWNELFHAFTKTEKPIAFLDQDEKPAVELSKAELEEAEEALILAGKIPMRTDGVDSRTPDQKVAIRRLAAEKKLNPAGYNTMMAPYFRVKGR